MAAFLVPIWKWLATHAAPWIAAFMLGVMWQSLQSEKALNRALEKADKQTAKAITDNANATVAAILASREAEETRLNQYEKLLETFRKNRAPIGGCEPGPAERDRLRIKIEAANRYAISHLPSGTGDIEGE